MGISERCAEGRLTVVRLLKTESTNKDALDYARELSPTHPVLIAADEQTAGRGRLGRSFISPRGGIYMTLLYPLPREFDAFALTARTALSVCLALERLTELSPRIKWVNDVYIGERKLSGILTQGAFDSAGEKITHAAIGIGLNVTPGELAPEIRDIATSLELEGCEVGTWELIDAITEEFLTSLEGDGEWVSDYRERSMLIGREITVISPTESYEATAVGIGDACELIVELPSGERRALSTGDVSVRWQK